MHNSLQRIFVLKEWNSKLVLYTHQKLKKAKTWHDGVLKVLTPGTRAILYDDKKNKIDTVHIKPEAIVSGEQLESDRHLILIEEIKPSTGHDQAPVSRCQSGGREQHIVPSRPHVPVTTGGTGGRLSVRAGIKRRKTGFVPPRMIKQPRLDEDQVDACEIGYNNPLVRANPPSYTNQAPSNPNTASILNLYSRTGAPRTDDNLRPSYKQNAESTSSVQSNSEPFVPTPPDQMSKNQSPLLGRLAGEQSPGTVSHPSSPWSSFGAGRLKSLGSDSPKSKEGGTNEELLNGTRLNNHQNHYSRTTNFCERNTLLSEKDQNIGSCIKNVSGFVSNACADSQRTFSKLPVTGHNTSTKRSASQIMALLGKSRNRDSIQTGNERPSESQAAEISKGSSGLPVSQDNSSVTLLRDNPILPVSHDSPILPGAQDSRILPESQDSPILPVSRDSRILPVALHSPILPVAGDSPILPVLRDSPIVPMSRDSPILPVARDSPILPVSWDSPIVPMSRDSPILPVSLESPIVPMSRDSPILPVARDSPILPVSLESPILPMPRDSSILPVSLESPILPVSRKSPILPVAQENPILPLSRNSPILPASRDSPILPVSRYNSVLRVSQNSTSNCPRFVDSRIEMQHQASVRTSYHGEMQDLSSDFDISLSPSSVTPNKQPDSIEVTPLDVQKHNKLVQYNAEEGAWTKGFEKSIDKGRISKDHDALQNCINKENESENFQEKDLHEFTQEKIEEGIVSEAKIERYGYTSTSPGSKEELGNKSTNNDLAAMAAYECNEKERPDTYLSDDDDDNSDVGQQPSFLISYSPLSQEVYSDDEADVCGSHNTDVDPKQTTMEDKESGTQEGHIVGKKEEWIDRTVNPGEISSVETEDVSEGNCFHNSNVDSKQITWEDGEKKLVEKEDERLDRTENPGNSVKTSIQHSDSSEGSCFHNSNVESKQITLEDTGTQEKKLVEKEDEWIEKPENLDKMSSQETNVLLADLSEGNSEELRDSQPSEDKNAHQVLKTEGCADDSDALVDSNVSKEQFNGLNDLNFSPDSVAFASLSSIEGREENNRSNETSRSWQVKRTVPGSHVVTDIPRFTVMGPKKTNQVFSETKASGLHPISQDTVIYHDIMPNITNITPKSDRKHLPQCYEESEPSRFETTSHECTPNDVSGSDQEGSGKSYSLPSSGDFPLKYPEVSMLQGSEASVSQTESVNSKFGRDTPLTGFNDSPCVENISPDLVCHSSENSRRRELPGNGMPLGYQYDNCPVRATQDQHTFVESVRYKHIRPPGIMENCSLGEDHLPHPSQLLRRPNMTSNLSAPTISPMDEEDPFKDRVDPGPVENAAQKLEQYKVRGSISGGVARRVSKSTPGVDYHQTRSPAMSAMGDPTARENLFSSMSPSQSLENNSFLPDQDDHSLFIDWNVGKPKLVDMTTLCNARDIKIPGSPYQHVPTACGSPQSYDGGREGRINDVPDIDFGRARKPDNPITAENFSFSPCFSVKSSPDVFTPGCDLQNVPSESIRQPCEVESPTYGNLFREKRNMISCESKNKVSTFGNNLDKTVVIKKEKVSLKCKPFQDSFTHTSYSSSYFSPARVDSRKSKDDTSRVDLRGQNDTPADVNHTEDQKDILDRVNFRGQMDTTKYVRHMYSDSQVDIQGGNDNNNNKEQSVRSESPEKKTDLHLSLSSVGSSDLELSFTLNEHYQGQPKPSTDLSGVNHPCTLSNIETGNLRSHAIPVGDFKSSGTSEENISCGDDQYNDSKWGKFIIKEDQDDDLLFDGSFDEQYNVTKSGNRMCFRSVNEPRRTTQENSNQQQCYNTSYSDTYGKSTLNATNVHSSQRLSLSDQKTYTGIHGTQKHTMSSLPSNQMLAPAIPLPDSKDVSPAVAEMENVISQDFLMDDFDMQETEDMMVNSTFSKQSNAEPDLHMVPTPVCSTAIRPVVDSDVTPTEPVSFQGTSTALSKREGFLSRQNAMKKSPNLALTSVAECDFLSQRQNTKKFHSPVPSAGLVTHVMKGSKRNISGELQFASKEEVDSNPAPLREVSISVNFPTVAVYKRVLTAALKEHLNIIMFGQAQQYHHALGMVDITNFTSAKHQGPLANKPISMNKASSNPSCQCGVPSKMIQVKKAGNNKGRFFYACTSARNKQCKFFQWVDQTGGGQTSTTGGNKLKLCEASSINTYMRGNSIMLYCECELLKKTASDITSHFKKGFPNWVKMKYEQANQDKKKLYIKLSMKDASSMYSKDDLWIISTTLNFQPSQTFLAKSAYFGPSSASEVEIEPLAGFSPSNWQNHAFCHALLAGNISSELCYLSNIEDNMNPASLPILPWILDSPKTGQRELSQQVGFKAPVRTAVSESNIFATKTSIMELAEEFIQMYRLNTDQTSALMRVCHMFCGNGPDTEPVLLIHGVFGAGKSFLLSVIVLFLVRLFEVSDSHTPGVPYPWKVLISSTTNVAVDRILLGLLEIGFEDFVRVGSMKKISKPVLPFSVHATGSESQELKDLQEMLRSGELTPSEKHNVRQSIEKHRLGENKKRLSKVRVVGVTCASCTASSLDKMTFPVVLLDESSQMTEPASMLPIAKFGCEKLLLVGDPKQLDPTIQGSEAAHSNGLEQTLFDRLMKMGHTPTMLHTQYRCHPVISNLANTLFYDGRLIDGITTSDREPLVLEIPTLCFYDVSSGQEQADDGGSFYNEKEAVFVTSLIQQLLERGVEPASIGVITLYKSQMYKINTSLLTNVRSDSNKEIKATRVSTVDAFQGGEHDIIILSCVRTKGIGFIDNPKRTNVALTRARHHLLIVGKKSNLSQNKLWGQVLKLCSSQPGGVCEADTFLQQLGNTDRVRSQDKMGSTPCSPPMSLSSQGKQDSFSSPGPKDKETNSAVCSLQHDKENAETGQESPPLTPPPEDRVAPVRRKCRLINADLLECPEASDSDEDLPTF